DRGTLLAVLVFHLNVKGLSQVMADVTGLGKTGETFLVNPDKLMVNQARVVKEDTVLKRVVDTEEVRRALETKGTGQGVYKDYRGVPVLGTYAWIPELKMVMVSKVDAAEAFAPIAGLRTVMLAVLGVTAVLVVAAALWLSAGLTRQVRNILHVFNQIGMG